VSKTSRSIVGDKDDSVRFQSPPDRKLLRPIPKTGHSRAPSTSMQPPFCKGGYGIQNGGYEFPLFYLLDPWRSAGTLPA